MAQPVEVPSGSKDPIQRASPAAGSQQLQVPAAGESSLPPTTPTTSEQAGGPMAGEASLPPTTPTTSEQAGGPMAGEASLPPTPPTTSPMEGEISVPPTTAGEAVVDGPKSAEPVQETRDTPASPVRANDEDEELSALLMANVVSCQQNQFNKANLVTDIFESTRLSP